MPDLSKLRKYVLNRSAVAHSQAKLHFIMAAIVFKTKCVLRHLKKAISTYSEIISIVFFFFFTITAIQDKKKMYNDDGM